MMPVRFEEKHMDTRVTVSVHALVSQELRARVQAAFAVFAAYEAAFSGFRADSELSRVNRQAGETVLISEKFNELLAAALVCAAASGGAFDPLVGGRTLPSQAKTDAETSWRDIRHDATARTVRFPAGTALDLNAVVKGAALDAALEALSGDEPALIEAGGDLVVRGLPPGKDRWDIGIRDPRDPRRIVTILPLKSGAVCTSGEYLRGRLAERQGREHLVGPFREFTSLTVTASSASTADPWSTAAYLMSTDAAMEFVERQGGAVLAVDGRGTVLMSPLMRGVFARAVNA